MKTCQAWRYNSLGRQQCGQPAVVEMTAICVHEHLDVADVCAECRVVVESDGMDCSPCRRGPAAHGCTLRLIDAKPLGFSADTISCALDDSPSATGG